MDDFGVHVCWAAVWLMTVWVLVCERQDRRHQEDRAKLYMEKYDHAAKWIEEHRRGRWRGDR